MADPKDYKKKTEIRHAAGFAQRLLTVTKSVAVSPSYATSIAERGHRRASTGVSLAGFGLITGGGKKIISDGDADFSGPTPSSPPATVSGPPPPPPPETAATIVSPIFKLAVWSVIGIALLCILGGIALGLKDDPSPLADKVAERLFDLAKVALGTIAGLLVGKSVK